MKATWVCEGKMMNRKLIVRIGWGVVCALGILIVADSFDFVSRWLGCVEPYKDNLERLFYFAVIMFLAIRYGRKIPEQIRRIRGLKIAARGLGFEVEFNDAQSSSAAKVDADSESRHLPSGRHLREVEFATFALGRLGAEIGVPIIREAQISHEGVRYRLDGFAVKHGHAYAVEVRVSYRLELRRQYFDQLRRFTKAITEQARQNLTFVFCLLTDVPVEEIRRQLGDIDQIVGCDVVIRTFTAAEVEGAKKPTET